MEVGSGRKSTKPIIHMFVPVPVISMTRNNERLNEICGTYCPYDSYQEGDPVYTVAVGSESRLITSRVHSYYKPSPTPRPLRSSCITEHL